MIRLIVTALVMFFATLNQTQAQKEKYQSLFIYNFSKYIKWPDSYNSGKFVIGIVGKSPMAEPIYAMAMAKKQTGNGALIEVKAFGSVDEIENCNILFVSNDFCSKIKEITNFIAGKPMLIVTEKSGMANKGAAINFIEKDGKIKFELNKSATDTRGLKVSGSLISVAILI